MCWGCLYDDHGLNDEEINVIAARPEVVAVAARIEAFYRLPECGTGGPIHVVLVDTNVENAHLRMYRASEYPAEIVAAATEILEGLRALTVPERAVATVIASRS